MSLASDLIQKVQIGASQLKSFVDSNVGEATEFVRKNPVTSSAAISGGLLAGVTAVQVVRKSRKKSSKAKKSTSKTRKSKSKSRSKNTKKKRKTTKSKRSPKNKIKHTKTGQPYIILPSGKARFISKKSEKLRKKRKGGYY